MYVPLNSLIGYSVSTGGVVNRVRIIYVLPAGVVRCQSYGAFACGGIDGKLGGLTPMNSYPRLVCIRNRPQSLAVTRQRVIVASY